VTIQSTIQAYHSAIANDPDHRYRSWEHCYGYFRRIEPTGISQQRDHAALQLGFYLASWGMYRGSSFLLQRAYTAHLGVIDLLTEPRFSLLWEVEYGAGDQDTKLGPLVLQAVAAVREVYRPIASANNSGEPTDTLVTKVLLGTFGCLPACDNYFISGFKRAGFSYSRVSPSFIGEISDFSRGNLQDFRAEQTRIERLSGIHYPLMKLVDMYFWQSAPKRT
jgi:hypothetical protein